MSTEVSIPIDRVERLEAACLKEPQLDCPVTNIFLDGIYWRELSMPADCFAIGHRHKTEHLNVMLSGRVRVIVDGQVKELVAPQVFKSEPGVKKIVYAIEPTRWANVLFNPTNETDQDKLELLFIEKSGAFLEHEAEMKRLKEAK